MGVSLFGYIWISVIGAHITFFGGGILALWHSGFPQEFLQKIIRESVSQVIKDTLEQEGPSEIAFPSESDHFWYSSVAIFGGLVGSCVVLVWLGVRFCVHWFNLGTNSFPKLEDSPRSPALALGVVARQQLAEIRLRHHVDRQNSIAGI